MTTENQNRFTLLTLAFLVCAISGWSAYHSTVSRKYQDALTNLGKYQDALINLGVSNCRRISQLEKYSYGYKDANLKPNSCPNTEEFLNQ